MLCYAQRTIMQLSGFAIRQNEQKYNVIVNALPKGKTRMGMEYGEPWQSVQGKYKDVLKKKGKYKDDSQHNRKEVSKLPLSRYKT
jgi:hypothetical protein